MGDEFMLICIEVVVVCWLWVCWYVDMIKDWYVEDGLFIL